MSSEGPTNGGFRKAAVLLLTALSILVADQVTKALVVANLAVGEKTRLVGDVVQVWHAQNRGAAFSLFQGGSLVFLIVSVLSIGMVGYFHRSLRDRPTWLHVVLGIVLGGTLGNFTDRLRQGYVTDWLSVGIGDTRWPTFNVADSSVVVGIGILVIYLLLTNPDRREATA
ncbi:MAG TPA: signal peptidase II [Candidatus Limnocylindria bacterium]|nr:signal peptidase II [Candidatus Limnocylindria bacterium]